MTDKTSKTDNQDPRAKLALRRYFLAKYHADGPRHVLDCCQGGGVLWKRLLAEYPADSYWGLDLKQKKGRLKIDSSRILAQSGWPQNIVDIDTYGSPWKHYRAMLPNISQPTTVFVTVGQKVTGIVGKLSKEAIGAIGLKELYTQLPPAFHVKLAVLCCSTILFSTAKYGIMVVEAMETISGRNARYIGLRLSPKTNGHGGVTRGRSEHTQAEKEPEHV